MLECCRTLRSGPGYWLLKPYMMTLWPPMSLRTNPAVRSSTSPSANSITSPGVASGSMLLCMSSRSAPGKNGSTVGVSPPRNAIMDMSMPCMGGIRQPLGSARAMSPGIPGMSIVIRSMSMVLAVVSWTGGRAGTGAAS